MRSSLRGTGSPWKSSPDPKLHADHTSQVGLEPARLDPEIVRRQGYGGGDHGGERYQSMHVDSCLFARV
jgi:hypothetical protein